MALSKQGEATWSSSLADPQPYGYDPQYDPIVMPKKFRIRDNRLVEEDLFFKRFNERMPDWWPRFRNGKARTHLYRLLDYDFGHDKRPPPFIRKAMSHILREEHVTDFSHQLIKEQAIKHVDKMSEGDYAERPFLSFSGDLETFLVFGSSHVKHWRAKGHTVHEVYVRLDLFALWRAGYLTETSFADISTENKFDAYFQGAFGRDWLNENYIEYSNACAASCRLQDLLMGIRGRWWMQFCVVITHGDAVAADQTAYRTCESTETFGTYVKRFYRQTSSSSAASRRSLSYGGPLPDPVERPPTLPPARAPPRPDLPPPAGSSTGSLSTAMSHKNQPDMGPSPKIPPAKETPTETPQPTPPSTPPGPPPGPSP